MKNYTIGLRNCGAVGWLGILTDEYGEEVYRTGTHYATATLALSKVQDIIAAGGIK